MRSCCALRPAGGKRKQRERKQGKKVHGKIGSRRSEEHTSELQSPCNLVCRLLLEKQKRAGSAARTMPTATIRRSRSPRTAVPAVPPPHPQARSPHLRSGYVGAPC